MVRGDRSGRKRPGLGERNYSIKSIFYARGIASRRFGFQALTLFLTALFDHFFVGGQGLLGLLRAAGAAVGLAELEVGQVAVGEKLFGLLEAGDSALGVALLQQCAAKLEVSQLVVRLGFDHVAEQGCRIVGVAERKQREREVIARDGIGGPQRELGAKFLGGVLEFSLVEIDQSGVVVRFRQFGIELYGSF